MTRDVYFTGHDSIAHNGRLVANYQLIERSKKMSRQMTKAEQILWFHILSQKKLGGYKFTKQKIIGNYILDFYCSELLLAIEADGESHLERSEYDQERDKFLASMNIETIRIQNNDIYHNLSGVHKYLIERI